MNRFRKAQVGQMCQIMSQQTGGIPDKYAAGRQPVIENEDHVYTYPDECIRAKRMIRHGGDAVVYLFGEFMDMRKSIDERATLV